MSARRPPLAWWHATRGWVSHVDWADEVRRPQAVDPYLVWADLTAFTGFGGWGESDPRHRGFLPLTVELDAKGLAPSCGVQMGLCRIGTPYLTGQSSEQMKTRYRHLNLLVQPRALGIFLQWPALRRYQLGLPRVPDVGSDLPPVADAGPTSVRTVLGFIDDGCGFAHPNLLDADGTPRIHALWDQGRAAPDGPGVWSLPTFMGYGAELRHAALATAVRPADALESARRPDAGYRRVDYLPTRPRPDRAATSALAARGDGPPIPHGLLLQGTHGTGVMDLAMGQTTGHAAGRSPPLRDHPRLRRRDPAAPLRDLDGADAWAGVFVQLPVSTVLDTSGGSLAYHVLDGLHYIVDRAQRIAGPGKQNPSDARNHVDNPVIVTLSYGAIAGSHDGTSILEGAIAELVEDARRQRLWVVLAAGNAHRSRTHARAVVDPSDGAGAHLLWQVPPDNPHEAFLEVWLPHLDVQGHALPSASDGWMLRIKPPGEAPPVNLPPGSIRLLGGSEAPQAVVAGVVFARRVAQTSTPSTMVLVAVAPTRAAHLAEGPPRAAAPHGEWQIELTPAAAAAAPAGPAVEIHAWTERSDLVFRMPRRQQTRVRGDLPVPEPTEFTRRAAQSRTGPHEPDRRLVNAMAPERSMGGFAHVAPSRHDFFRPEFVQPVATESARGALVVVGAYRRSDGEMASYSGGGPSRLTSEASVAAALAGRPAPAGAQRQAPDVDAPADIGPATPGVATAGLWAGARGRLSGTSAAAPTVARLIANAQGESGPPPEFETVFFDTAAPPEPPAIRGTPRPAADDAFRRGRRRAR